jgi:hypothetical protein
MSIDRRVRKLIESTAKTDNGPSALEARNGCRRDTRRLEFSQADHSALPEKGYRPALLTGWAGWLKCGQDTFPLVTELFIRGFVSSSSS